METENKKSLKEKADDLKWWAKCKCTDAKIWCKNHKAEIITLAPVLISGTIELVKIVAKKGTVKEEQHLKDEYIYDRSNGHYYELRRKIKSSEWQMIDHRKREGEMLGDILQDMRLLK